MTDEELLVAAATDPAAFAALYRRHAPGLLAWCARRAGGDRELAADLVAETFAAALEGCGRYRPERGPAAAWLYGIARNQASQAARRGAVERRALARLGIERPAIEDAEFERALARDPAVGAALGELPSDQRAAVFARVVDDHDYDRIAADTASTPAAVRQRVSRGLAALRRSFTAAERGH